MIMVRITYSSWQHRRDQVRLAAAQAQERLELQVNLLLPCVMGHPCGMQVEAHFKRAEDTLRHMQQQLAEVQGEARRARGERTRDGQGRACLLWCTHNPPAVNLHYPKVMARDWPCIPLPACALHVPCMCPACALHWPAGSRLCLRCRRTAGSMQSSLKPRRCPQPA